MFAAFEVILNENSKSIWYFIALFVGFSERIKINLFFGCYEDYFTDIGLIFELQHV